MSRLKEIIGWEVVPQKPPHDNLTWVRVIAHIRKNDTGEIRQHETNMIWDEKEDVNYPGTYNWEIGNFSCDCNRERFFNWDDDEYESEYKCGNDAYSVNLQNPVSERYFYKEF